jgi:hypothetical protein
MAASETTLKRQKTWSKIMQNACKKHVKKRHFKVIYCTKTVCFAALRLGVRTS